MDEQKDLSVNNEGGLDNNDSSVNDDIPKVEENANTSNASDERKRAGNGYMGLASSNREAFSHGFKEKIVRNKVINNQHRLRGTNLKKGTKNNNHFDSDEEIDLGKENVKRDLLNNKLENKNNKPNKTSQIISKSNDVIKSKIKNWILFSSLPIFIVIISLLVVFIGIVYFFGFDSSASGGSGGSLAVGGQESGFTISATSLSKTEFKNKIQEYANSNPQWQVFADNANDYYDYAKAKQVNPELVVVVADKEGGGYTTSGANNYWGLECPNGASYCGSYGSFMEGARKLIDSASKYSTLREWFEDGSYSFIGYFWYNPGSWGEGGCKYAEYIYPDGLPERVQKACSGSLCECLGESVDGPAYRNWVKTGNNSRPECTPTLEEDQEAYTTYLIKEKMGKSRERIFGLKFEEGVTNTFYKTGEVVEDYVNWMIALAADDTRGYSQSTRYMNPNVDCSSFVYYGLLNGAGFTKDELGNSAFTTTNMIGILQKLGFKVYSYEEDKLIRGDILWKNGHTEVYIGDGKNVGAHTDYDGINGDGNGKEVNVASNYTGWTYYIRYVGNKD